MICIQGFRPPELVKAFWREILHIRETDTLCDPEYIGGNMIWYT